MISRQIPKYIFKIDMGYKEINHLTALRKIFVIEGCLGWLCLSL